MNERTNENRKAGSIELACLLPFHLCFKNAPNIDLFLQLPTRLEKLIECGEVEFVGENLNDAIHQIILCDLVLAAHHFLQQPRQYGALVVLTKQKCMSIVLFSLS